MPTLLQLPDNATALLKNSEDLTNREVKVLRRAARKVGIVGQRLKDLGLDTLREESDPADDSDEAKAAIEERNNAALKILTSLSDEEDDDLDLFQRTCAAIRLIEWSLDIPLPKTAEDVDCLPRGIYTALTVEADKLDLNETFDMESAMNSPKETAPDTSNSDVSELSLEAVPS